MLSLIRSYLRKFRYSAWVLEGAEKHSGAELRMLYLGGYEVNKNYVENLVFRPPIREINLGRFWLFRPTGFINKRLSKADMAVTEIKNEIMGNTPKSGFYIPCWIDGKIDIDETLRLTETDSKIKCDLRRISKFRYTYEVVREKEKFIDFYNNMYVPHINKNYGNESTLRSLDNILSKLEYSELLLIKDGEKSVAGEVIVYRRSGPKILCLGVLDGDHRYVKEGVICALYYFRSIYLKKKEYAEVDLGASRGFLNDGVLKFKKKWGINLTAIRGGGFMIHRLTLRAGTKSFLKNNPFIVSEPDGFSSVCFLDENAIGTEKEQNKLIKTLTAPGIKKLLVFQLDADKPIMVFSQNSPVPVEVRHMSTAI